ncbi:ORF2/3 [Torque teno virus 3]|uniref:ORF2/4 protein n=1 Tax=Torque teno virus (isolate Human/Finland/Hel32/2002) TaxID=687342 RepID=ORF24_TTVV3|nr:ORF2/3 [Torque teno virus 3]A7XCC9.1 RecName: Full=ORF2/4 protein [Torque teno virus 3]ABV25031.1 ORF2/3 [Torque teno virus 3]
MWQPPTQNGTQLERHWFESVWRSHAAFCSCGDCIGHLQHLATNLGRPPAPQPPRDQHPPHIRGLPALPAPPSNRNSWPGTGGDAAGGEAGGSRGAGDGGDGELADEDLLDAIALAADPQTQTPQERHPGQRKNARKRLRFSSPTQKTPALDPLQSRNKRRRGGDTGGPGTRTTSPAAPAAATPQSPARVHCPRSPQNQEGAQPPPPTIFPCINKVFMFNPPGPKRITGYEAWRDEYETCKAWNRPPRSFYTDIPTYTWMPKAQDQFRVSFKLGFH